MLTVKRVSFSAAGIHPSSNGDVFAVGKTGLGVSKRRQHCVMNSVGGHVVAAARPDPRIVHEIERTQSPEPMVRRELGQLAQYGVTAWRARPLTRWGHVLLRAQPRSQTDGVPSIVVHRLHPGTRRARASTLHRPQAHKLKIARASTERNWASAFHGASDPPNLQHTIPFSTKGPIGLFMVSEDLHARALSL